ncbi:MAG: MopE-related protein, partial [Myxococcota bacterium]|nr:MopE-related protein [Myxococcota bacterium]
SSALFAKEDLVRCTVQISDTEIGQSLSESITILNTLPVAGDISITDPVTLADIIYCEASSSDIDEDNLIHEYIWYVNGAAITHTNSFLNASSSFFNLNADDEVYCTATPFDGSEYGTTLTSPITTLLPAEISVNGSISFHGYPVGGIDIVADTYPITTAHSSDADGTYNLSVPTLSGAILSLDIHNETLPSSLVLDIDNGDIQIQDFDILTSTFPLAPDQYESDNGYVDPYNFADSMQSSTIVVDEALQYRTLYPPGDEDWIAVDLVENTSYTFFTTLLYHSNDTTLFLYDAQGTQLAYNDNFLGNSSLIQDFIAPSTGTYFLKVDTYETQDLAFYLLGAMQTIDDDGDTIPLYFDCDDQSSAIEPFASEIYSDNIDQDCDGIDLIDPSNLDSVEAMGSGYAVSISEMKSHIGEHIYRSVSGAYSLHSGQDIDLFSVEIPAKSKALVQVDLHGSTHTIGLDLLSSSNTLLQSTTSQDDLYIENNSSIAQLYYIYTRNDIDEIPVNYNIFWFDFGTDNDLDGYYSMDWNAIRDQNDADPSVY